MKDYINEIVDKMEIGRRYTINELTKGLTEKEKATFRAYIWKNKTDKFLLTEEINGIKYYFRF